MGQVEGAKNDPIALKGRLVSQKCQLAHFRLDLVAKKNKLVFFVGNRVSRRVMLSVSERKQ